MNNVNTSPRYLEGPNAIDYTQMPFPCENPVLQREQTKQIANILRFRNLINKNLYIQQLKSCLFRGISAWQPFKNAAAKLPAHKPCTQ